MTHLITINEQRAIGRLLSMLLLLVFCCVSTLTGHAQRFFNLTASEVRIDSVLPHFYSSYPLGPHYADSVYEVHIDYPEFIDMSREDVARYQQLSSDDLPAMPVVQQYVGVARKQGTLYLSMVPLVKRDGKYQKLVSFSLRIESRPVMHARRQASVAAHQRYAAHSVLSTGRWAKIRVPESGVYQLTESLIRKAGFSSLSKVKIYGYGGALQPEKLTGDYLVETDDLRELPTCVISGRRLFYGVGPVNWLTNSAVERTRNPYSDYGYYFLTEGDDQPLMTDSASFVSAFYPGPNDYHDLYEVDNYAWYHGGRNLYHADALVIGSERTISLPGVHTTSNQLYLNLSYNATFSATISMNGVKVGTIKATAGLTSGGKLSDSNAEATQSSWTFNLPDSVQKVSSNKLSILQSSGGEVRLDYVSLRYSTPKPLPNLHSANIAVPEFVYRITPQDRHADAQADMVIIIPTSQLFFSEAQRLKSLHETYDGMRVNIVPADELYNEFSSGTPDATAYRRYLKMLYDRAETEADMPRYLLLFGDGAWDNRMLSSDWRGESPDHFLLCYESDNSFSATKCYVSDDYFCLLDDGEGGNVLGDRIDVSVGRLSARTAAEAKVLVDKICDYRTNAHAGSWQNVLAVLGDDGDNNRHMLDAELIADVIAEHYQSFHVKKIYWDAYTRTSSSTGNSYPDVTRLIKQQMRNGALMINYSGHGRADAISHEYVMRTHDFAEAYSMRLPLWVTASCDIVPFDGQEENIGETAMNNARGGAIAFFGTTRTVYSTHNRPLNQAFTRYVLGSTNGQRNSIGDAARMAKNDFISSSTDMMINKQHYVLLGDPALVLAAPTLEAVIDSLNGYPLSAGAQQLAAGSVVTVKGHVANHPDFNGIATLTLRDIEETITGHNNSGADSTITYQDRPNTIYVGTDSVRAGAFTFTFVIPKDISYSDQRAQFLIYAVNDDRTLEAHGENNSVVLAGSADTTNDGIGPSVYCYLNSEAFVNGGTVNATPYFFAQLTDKDGINVAGNGIGHDLELVIDNDINKTYNLNDLFQYDFGDYRSGTVGYSIPALPDGKHRLQLRAWDAQNNSTIAVLDFVVKSNQTPSLSSVVCTRNPAITSTQFVISHDRIGNEMNVELEIFDTSGRKLWSRSENAIPTDQTYTIDWDLTTGSGSKLHTGVYLYRVLISSNGSHQASQARKLIVLAQ